MRSSLGSTAALLVLQAVVGWRGLAEAAVTKDVLTGSIFRRSTYVSVDHYTLEVTSSTAIMEFDLLSMETTNNATFVDVNQDCDSAYIDPHIFLFQKATDGSLTYIASNDDAGDDNAAYYSRGRDDGSLSQQDSYLIRQLGTGTYVLAVGRYPLALADAMNGKSTSNVGDYTPYACHARKASYGNYKLTIRTQSTATASPLRQAANSYVGNSCAVASNAQECVFALPANVGGDILAACSYDKTIY